VCHAPSARPLRLVPGVATAHSFLTNRSTPTPRAPVLALGWCLRQSSGRVRYRVTGAPMTSTLDSLLKIPPFAPSGLEPRRRRIRNPGLSLFRTDAQVASWRELPVWPVLLFAWMAVLLTFFASLH